MREDDSRSSLDVISRPVRRQILGGRYTVLKELGRGASGVVMLCRRKEDQTLFAVKEIHTGQDVAERRRIYEEGKLMLNIPPHPSIVRIEEVSESRDSVFLVIEYVPDGSLHSVVYTDDVLDTQERQRDARRERDTRKQLRGDAKEKRRRRHRRKIARDAGGGGEQKEKSHSKMSGWGGTGTDDQWDQMSGLRSDDGGGSSLSPTGQPRQVGGSMVETPLTSGFGDAGRNALMGLFAQDSLGAGSTFKGGSGRGEDHEFDGTANPPRHHIYSDLRSPGDDDVWGDEGVEEAYANRGWGTEGEDANEFNGGDATTPTDDLSSLTHSSDPRPNDNSDSQDEGNSTGDEEDFSLPLLSEITITKWMSQLANAVDYLHHLRIAHRDIKLENILVSSGGAVVKICDFGVAATIPEASAHSTTTTASSSPALPPRGTMLGLKPQSAQSSIRPLLASKAVVPVMAAMAISGLSPRRQQIESRGGGSVDDINLLHNESTPVLHGGGGPGSGFIEHATVGTPQYMPPEICDGRAHDLKCDVWSLGVTFYELCARVLPFEATNLLALMHRIMEEPAAPIPTPPFSPHLNAILLAMLSKEPSRRPTIKQVTQMFQHYRRCRTNYEQQLDEDMLRRVAAGERVPQDLSAKPDHYSQMPFDGNLGVAGFTPAPQPTNFRTLDEIMAGSYSGHHNNNSFPATAFGSSASLKQHPRTPPEAVSPEFGGLIVSNPSSHSNFSSVSQQGGSRGVNPAWPVPPPLSVGAVMMDGDGDGGGVDSASFSPVVVTNSSFVGISPKSARILASIPIQPTTSAANTPRRPHQGVSSRVVSASSSGATRSNSGIPVPSHQEQTPTATTRTFTNHSNNPQLPPRPPLPVPHPSISSNPTTTSHRIVPGMSKTAGTAEGLAAAQAAKAVVLRELQEEYLGGNHHTTSVTAVGSGMVAVSGSQPRRGESPLSGITPRGGGGASPLSAAVVSKPQTAPLGGINRSRGGSTGVVIGGGGGVSPPSSSNRIPFGNMQFATPDGGGIPSGGDGGRAAVGNTSHLKGSGRDDSCDDIYLPLDSFPNFARNFNNNGSGILETSAHLMNTANTVEDSSFETTPLCSGRRGGGRGGSGVSGAGFDDVEGGSVSEYKRSSPESASHYELHTGDAASEQERRKNNIQQLHTTNNVFLHSGALAAFLSESEDTKNQEDGRLNFSRSTAATNQNLQSTLGSTYYTVVRGGGGGGGAEVDAVGCSTGTMPYGRGSRPSGVVDTTNLQDLSGTLDDRDGGTPTATMSNGCTSPPIRRRPTDTHNNNNNLDSASKSSIYSATSPEALRSTARGGGSDDGYDGPPRYQDDDDDHHAAVNEAKSGDSDGDEILRSAASPYSSVNPRNVTTTTIDRKDHSPPTTSLLHLQGPPGGVTKSLQALLREENERDERDLQLPQLRGPVVRGVKGGSKTTSISFDHNHSISSAPDIINNMGFNAAISPRSSRSSRGGSYTVGESHSIATSPVAELLAQPYNANNKNKQSGWSSPMPQNARTWHLPTVPAAEASILSPTSLVMLPSNDHVVMSNNSFATLTSASGHPTVTTGLAHLFELDGSNLQPGTSKGTGEGGGPSSSKLVRKTSLIAATGGGSGGVGGSGHRNSVVDTSLVDIPTVTGTNLHHPLITGRSLLGDFNDEATTPLPDIHHTHHYQVNRLSPSQTGDITVEDVEDATGSAHQRLLTSPTTTTNNNSTTHHPNSPPLNSHHQHPTRPPPIHPSSLLSRSNILSATELLSARTTTVGGGDGDVHGLEGSQIDESGVLVRWGSSRQRHSSSGGATSNPLVCPSLGTSQHHDGGISFGGGIGSESGRGFSPLQSGIGGPQTAAVGFSSPSTTYVVESGVYTKTGGGGVRRRGTGESHESGGGGDRRVSTLWGLDGPLTGHTRTSSSISLNASPTTATMPLPSPHDGAGGYSPTNRYESLNPNGGRHPSTSVGGSNSGGKVVSGGWCCTLQ